MFGMSRPPARKKDAAAAEASVEGQEAVEIRLSLTPAQRDKLDRLGGADWLRRAIDKARPPAR
jgi:hypothetical protein